MKEIENAGKSARFPPIPCRFGLRGKVDVGRTNEIGAS